MRTFLAALLALAPTCGYAQTVVGSIPQSVRGAAGGVAPLDSTARLPLPMHSPIILKGVTLQALGDSNISAGNYFSTYAASPTAVKSQTVASNFLGWLQAFSGGSVTFSGNRGYTGPYAGVLMTLIRQQGVCGSAPTMTFGAGSPTAQATMHIATAPGSISSGGFTYSYTAGQVIPDGLTAGGLPYIAMTTMGGGYASVPSLVLGAGCTTNPQLDPIVGGTGTFGVPGQNSNQIMFRTPDAIASGVKLLIVKVGANDCNAGIQPATTIANVQSILNQVLAAGITPIFMKLEAKTSWTLQTQANVAKCVNQAAQINRVLMEYARRTPGIWVYDEDPWFVNPADQLGGPMPNYTLDGTHTSALGAYWIGYGLWQTLKAKFAPIGLGNGQFSRANDQYDATNNPYGNLLPNGGFNGWGRTVKSLTVSTPGAGCTSAPAITISAPADAAGHAAKAVTTITSGGVPDNPWITDVGAGYVTGDTVTATASGGGCTTQPIYSIVWNGASNISQAWLTPGAQLAPGWSVSYAGTATAPTQHTTLTKAPRLDGMPGEEQVVTIAITAGAKTSAADSMTLYTAGLTPGTTPGVSVGGTYRAFCDVTITGASNLLNVGLTLNSTLGGGGQQQIGALVGNSTVAAQALPAGNIGPLHLETAPFTIATGAGAFYPSLQIDGGGPAWGATIRASRCGVIPEPAGVGSL